MCAQSHVQPTFTEGIASWQVFTFVVGVKEVNGKSYGGAFSYSSGVDGLVSGFPPAGPRDSLKHNNPPAYIRVANQSPINHRVVILARHH